VIRAREAVLDDYSQIAVLEVRNGLPAKPVEEWQHLWVSNPAYHALRGTCPIGWVLEDQNGQIVGSFGNIPLLLEFRGHPLIATSGRSWVVDPKYRGYAILLLNYFLEQKNVDLYLNATANAEAAAAFSTFQASRVPVGKWDESLFWITDYRGFVQSSLLRKSAPMASIASYPASVALSMVDKLIGRNRRETPSLLNICVADEFDDRFDAFWQRLRKSTRRLLTVRSCEVLNWHFSYALRRKELFILTANANGSLDGYAVFGRQDNHRLGLKRMRLVDFQCISEDAPAILHLMLTSALRRCVEDGIHMLELTGLRPDHAAVAKELSPYRRKLNAWRYLYKANDAQFAEVLTDPTVWDPTCYDGDASL